MTEQEAVKPPAQTVGVQGIEETPLTMGSGADMRVNWQAVAALPVFQMWVQEVVPQPGGRDPHQWAQDYAVRCAAQRGDMAVLEEYCTWHQQKGYWPNETPFGQLKE